jgi:hypothetical protein
LGNLQAFALYILVTWMPFILVMPCLGIWAILIRRELDNSDEPGAPRLASGAPIDAVKTEAEQ